MQIDAPIGLEDSAQLDQAGSHHREVGQHVALTQEPAKRLHSL